MRFSDSVLEIDVEAVAKVQGDEALCGLWNVFTKCKDSLRDGRRLENIAWRLWHREVFAPHGVDRGDSGTEQHILLRSDSHLPPPIGLSSISDCEEDTLVGTVDISPLSPDPNSSSILDASTGRRAATRHKPPTTSASARSSSQPSSRSPTTSASCSILDTHHRTSSAPNRLSADSQSPIKAINPGRSSVHIGQIISSLLPEKVNLSRSPRLPAAPHGPVPNALDVLSVPTHHNLHNQPLNVRTAPTGVLNPSPPESRQDPARRHHLTTFLPSSVSSVSSSSSCTSFASSIAGPSTPPSNSFMPAHITGSFGPPEAESHSGSATPRAPTSPTRTRSPANSSPRTSLYNPTHSNPSSPAAASHTNTNSNRLSTSARAAPTPSPNPLNANPACHRPTVILTNPTPRPTPSSTPSQPLSPADTPVSPSPVTNFPSAARQSDGQSPPPVQRTLARTVTTSHLLSYHTMSQQRRATPHLLAVPFAIPVSPDPEPYEQDDIPANVNTVPGSQSATAEGQRNRGYGGADAVLRGGDADILRMTPMNVSMRGKPPGGTLASKPHISYPQPIEAHENYTSASSTSSEGQHRPAGPIGADVVQTLSGAAPTGAGKIPGDGGVPVAPMLDDAARTAAARKIFFIQRSPPGDDRLIDGASSGSSGALSTSLISASIGAASSSRSPLEQRPPSSALHSHMPSPAPREPANAAEHPAPNNETNAMLHPLVTPLSPNITQPPTVASPSAYSSATIDEGSTAEQHDSKARAPAPVTSTLADGDTRKLTGASRHVSDIRNAGASATPVAPTTPLEEQCRTTVTDKEHSSDHESVVTSEHDSTSLPHDHPAPIDHTHAMGSTTLTSTDGTPVEARGKRTVRALLPKSHSHANLHRKGARGTTLGLTRVTKAAHDKHAEKRASTPSRSKASRQSSGGSMSPATSTTGAHPDDIISKSGASANSTGSATSSSARSILHSRSPGSVSGTHRTFVSSPLSTGAVPAAVTGEPEIFIRPRPPLAAVLASNGVPKRPPIPGRSHTLASIIRPSTGTPPHAMKPQQSKSPSKRPQHHTSPGKAGGSSTAVVTETRRRPVLDMTSSDSGVTSDDSMWSSDDEEEVEAPLKGANKGKGRASGATEHKELGHLARDAALEAARQRDMFRKVPSRSYSSLGLRRQTGLLTPLLNPDPRLVPYLPANAQVANVMAQLGRPHNSAQNLGRRPPPLTPFAALEHMVTVAPPIAHMSTSPTPVLKPSKSAAEVRIAPVSVTTQVVVNPSGRPGYRPKGRPDGTEVESDDDEDESNALDVDGMSKSVAQRKLEKLARLGQRQRSQQQLPQQPAMPSRNDLKREHQLRQPYPSPQASYIPHETQGQEYYPYHSVELTRTPSMPLPHPYNLPAPAPPQSPRTTRRQMMANEMSESLRRNLLWERTLTRRMLGGFTRINPALPTNGRASAPGAQQHNRTGVEPRGSPTPLSRTRSWADDYHTSGW